VSYLLQDLATLVGGALKGNGRTEITGVRPITEAGPGHLTFVEDVKHARLLPQCQAAAAVVGPDMEAGELPVICVAKPLAAFTRIAEHILGVKPPAVTGVHSQSSVAKSAKIGAEPSIGPFAVVGHDAIVGSRCRLMSGAVIGDGCRLGDDVVIHPNVVLYPDTVVGNRVIIHAGAVIGADGFGYRTEGGRHVKVPQLGHVEIGDDVEIGAGATIDRGTFHITRIGEGTKIDNLAQIAHNVQVGRHNLIVSQVGIAGSSKTGDYVIIAGQVGVKDHVTIGDRAIVGGMAGVMRDIPAGEHWVGIPATPEREQFRMQVNLHKIPELREQLHALAKRVEELEGSAAVKRKSA
jgi:UDP-3-O-[3-hydroxymyristoyl] glucosamine N-acyltransferase